MTYALIKAGQIIETGPLPTIWWDGERYWDFRDGQVNPTTLGWLPIELVARPADTETVTHEPAPPKLDVAGKPVQQWAERAWTAEETADRIARAAQLDDIRERIARIEATLWPPQPDTTPSADVPTMSGYGGIWPAWSLLSEGGKIWRNVAGVPLTTPPSGFSGLASAWAHLFVLVPPVTTTTTTPAPGIPVWSATAEYKVGDKVTRDGITYRCLVAHGAAYQGTWGPPNGSVWAVV